MKSAILGLILWAGCIAAASSQSDPPLEIYHTFENYNLKNNLDGTMTELLASKSDINASFGWTPSDVPLMATNGILAEATKNVGKPNDKYVWAQPMPTKMELLAMGGGIWTWKIHFYFDIDRTVKSQAIKGGELSRYVYVLPNGGRVVHRQRQMTPDERVGYGIDPYRSDSKAPAGPDPFLDRK